jgi:hypothetical protein
MEIGTIEQLKGLRDSVRESVKTIKPADYAGKQYGQENEYTAKGIVGGVEALSTDLSALIKSPARFVQLSNYQERTTLVTYFSNLNAYLSAKDLLNSATTIDQIKSIFRSFGVRHSSERKEEFLGYVDEMQKKCNSLSVFTDEVKAAKESISQTNTEADELLKSITTLHEKLTAKTEEIETLLEQADETRLSSKALLTADKTNSDEIQELLSEAKSHHELIESFVKKIESRERQLATQEEKTKDYLNKLEEHTKAQADYLSKANLLIENSKLALEYTTAEGLSAAFSGKYKELKEEETAKYWIIGAGIFIALAIGVGIWIVWEKSLSLETIVGRLSLLPILIGATWFCAGQYIKLKNLAEDYAYKSVLAKSLVGFSEQLSNTSTRNEEYTHFIKSVLFEMHNDPLDRRKVSTKNSTNESEVNLLFKKVIDSIEAIKENLPSGK